MIDRLCCQKKARGVFTYPHGADLEIEPERSLFFIRIDGLEDSSNPEANQLDKNSQPELLLRRMGLVLESADFKQYVKTDAEIVDIKTVALQSSAIQGEDYNMTTVLRSDGCVEFYCNYVFIETS